MRTTLFGSKDTKIVLNNVRGLFDKMSPEFRQSLISALMCDQARLEKILNSESLQGADLRNAYNHLSSFLERIKCFASEYTDQEFPGYKQWVTIEFRQFEEEYKETHQAVEELVSEGGVYALGKTSPAVTMANDSEQRYNSLKSEFEKRQSRSKEAIALKKSPQYEDLEVEADVMNKMLEDEIKQKSNRPS